MHRLSTAAAALLLSCTTLPCASFAQVKPSTAAPAPAAIAAPDFACRWSAELTASRPNVSETYAVPFVLDVFHGADGLHAALVNGSNRIDFSSATPTGAELKLRLEQYDSTLLAHCEQQAAGRCTQLAGEYTRQRGATLTHMAVTAKCAPETATPASAPATISGAWHFAFTDSQGRQLTEPEAEGNFTQQGASVEGTIAPVSGDYGLMAGEMGRDATLHLSRFDGVHALRLDGHVISANGSADRMEGVFHVLAGTALNFVATRTTTSTGFAESEHITTVADPSEPFRFQGIDASGKTVTQDDPRFHGKVVVLDLFGTWCPNCHDEAPVLAEMYRRFHDKDVEFAGLSYEYVDNQARNLHQIDVYRHKYGIEFPLLLVGTTDQVEKTLPQLRHFSAFPTTIFLDRQGRVRKIHAGFSGPATGRLDEVRKEFESTILELLNQP